MEVTQAASQPGFTFAYQPIINATDGKIIAYEALLRGLVNEPAYHVLQSFSGEKLHRFDEESRILALKLAASLGLTCDLNLNFIGRSLETNHNAIQSTLDVAHHYGISPDRIILEITEHEIIDDFSRFTTIINEYRGTGLRFAIDDFGAGYAGLNLLADFQPDIIKIDMKLVRDIESKGPRQAIVRGIVRTCLDLGIDIIAEGVETQSEFWWFREEGIEFFQGFLFARPALEHLPLAFYPQ